MKTKKLLLIALLLISVVGCKYDDGALWDKVYSLDERMTSVENKLSQMNADINSISVIVNALQNNIYVTSVEPTENGYQITFTDGKRINIKNGQDGKDAPVIGVDEFEGSYYWTQLVGGSSSWLSDKNGNKIPVTGADAVTPILKVNAGGYWVISYDRGVTFELLLDENNNSVKAAGENGINGDSFFSEAKVEDGVLILTLLDGTELKVPLKEELPEYIVLDQDLGDQVDYAILGLDGTGYFYNFQTENPNIPQCVSAYDGLNDKAKFVVNFDNEGMPKNIISDDFTIVLGKYEDNKFNAVIITKEGQTHLFEHVESSINWNDYKNGLSSLRQTRASAHPILKNVNIALGAISLGLGIVAAGPEIAVGSVVLLAIGEVGLIYNIEEAIGVITPSNGAAITSTVISHYANLASCAAVGTNWAALGSCLTGLANNVTAIADLIFNSNKEDIALGEGSLISGNGEIKITLTWDNYADIDLHCVDPSGFHIYYRDKTSPTGGFLDYDNTQAYGPENIFFSPAPEGAYHVYLHYYAENNGIRSVNYKVAIFNNGIGKTYEGTISGKGSTVDIATILFGTISNAPRSVFKTNLIDWNNLPRK